MIEVPVDTVDINRVTGTAPLADRSALHGQHDDVMVIGGLAGLALTLSLLPKLRVTDTATVGEGLSDSESEGRNSGIVPGRRAQFLDLAPQVFDVLELAIDRGEADVGDLVEGFQLAQHALPDCAGGDFGSASGQEIGFDAGQDGVDRILTDRALGERHPELLAQLDRIEVLAAAVLLDDHQIGALDPLVGREAPTAD